MLQGVDANAPVSFDTEELMRDMAEIVAANDELLSDANTTAPPASTTEGAAPRVKRSASEAFDDDDNHQMAMGETEMEPEPVFVVNIDHNAYTRKAPCLPSAATATATTRAPKRAHATSGMRTATLASASESDAESVVSSSTSVFGSALSPASSSTTITGGKDTKYLERRLVSGIYELVFLHSIVHNIFAFRSKLK